MTPQIHNFRFLECSFNEPLMTLHSGARETTADVRVADEATEAPAHVSQHSFHALRAAVQLRHPALFHHPFQLPLLGQGTRKELPGVVVQAEGGGGEGKHAGARGEQAGTGAVQGGRVLGHPADPRPQPQSQQEGSPSSSSTVSHPRILPSLLFTTPPPSQPHHQYNHTNPTTTPPPHSEGLS